MGRVLYSFRLGVLVGCLFLAGCWSLQKENNDSVAAQKLVVVNVLQAREHNDAHISGSINIPLDALEGASRAWDKATKVVVYCANYMCTASAEAARRLNKLGFKDVLAYEGGTAEWHTKGLPIDGPAQEGYLKRPGSPHAAPADVKTIDAQALKSEIDRAKKAGVLIEK